MKRMIQIPSSKQYIKKENFKKIHLKLGKIWILKSLVYDLKFEVCLDFGDWSVVFIGLKNW